jgi:membrane protein
MQWTDVKMLLAESVAGWSKHNAPRMGASLAFYTLLSLMPLLLVAISIAGLVFGSRGAESGVLQQLQILIGDQRAKIVEALLVGSQNKADGLLATVLGTLVLLFGATGVLTELRDALNTIWDVPFRRLSTIQELTGLVKQRLWSLALVLGIVVLLSVSLGVSTWIAALGSVAALMPAHEAFLHLFNAVFSFVAVTGIFGAVYKIVPQVRIEWPDVILGAAVTSLLFTLGNLLLGLYLGKASLSSTYGAASSTVALSLWVYYSAQIFFLGAEFTRTYAEHFGSSARRHARRVGG